MFAQRFDPTAVAAGAPAKKVALVPRNGLKRAREDDASDAESDESSDSDDSSSDDDSSSSSESDSDSSDESSASSDSSSDSSDSDSDSDAGDSDSDAGDASISDSRESHSERSERSDARTCVASEDAHHTSIEGTTDVKSAAADSAVPPVDGGDVSGDDMDVDVPENDPSYTSKHSSIFKKLSKVIQKGSESAAGVDGATPKGLDGGSGDDDEEAATAAAAAAAADVQDLAPLPQPMLPRDRKLKANLQHTKNLGWLATPVYTSPAVTQPFASLGVSPFMLKNLAKLGFDSAFSVQVSVLSMVLPEIRAAAVRPDFPGDVLVNAATGSGKTLAYSIPIIEALHTRVVPRVRAVILVPTRPLISQVKATLLQLASGTNLSVMSLKRDASIAEESRRLKLNVPDIVVSTPGRLVDHLALGSFDLSALKFLVVDEADRLLNQSFQNWCEVVIGASEAAAAAVSATTLATSWRPQTQKFIFSATLTTDAGKLASLKLTVPRLIIVNEGTDASTATASSTPENHHHHHPEAFQVPATLAEHKIHLGSAKASLKPVILARFLVERAMTTDVLIFTKSNESSLRLARLLTLLMPKLTAGGGAPPTVAYLNSTNNTTGVRTKILAQFQRQEISIIVATDLLARGIDLLSIKAVINYDLPNSAREYVHRVGRTARAQQAGDAFTFMFGKGEAKWYKTIMGDVGRGSREIAALDIDTKALVSKADEAAYEETLAELQRQVHES